MKKILFILLFSPLICQGQVFTNYYSASTSTPFVPTDLDSLKLWLKANAGVTKSGANVTTWADQSGLGNDFVQADTSLAPDWMDDSINGLPVIEFDGIDNVLSRDSITKMTTASISIFVVVKGYSEAITFSSFLAMGNYSGGGFSITRHNGVAMLQILNNSGFIIGGSMPGSGFSFLIAECVKEHGTQTNIWIDGVALDSSNDAPLCGSFVYNPASSYIGLESGFNWYFHGLIAEIIMYNTDLSPTDRVKIEAYLQTKYGL